MARRNVETFHTNIKQEGSEGATRGKIPVAMGRAMGAKDGDVIEWEVVNGDCVGGRVLSKSERREYIRESRNAPKATPAAKKTKSKTKGKLKSKKPVVKSTDNGSSKPKLKKPIKKLPKPSKRATKVSYEAPERKVKSKFKKPKLGLKKLKR